MSAEEQPVLMLRDAVIEPAASARIRGIGLVVYPGEVVAMRGESGSGKTTVLRAAAGLIPVVEGEIVLRTRNISMAFQEPRLLPWRTVLENVLFVVGAKPSALQVDRAVALLDRLGLTGVRDAMPATLSGGMRHRVGLARALLNEADLLLADEPFAHLDGRWAGVVAQLLTECASTGTAVLLAAHETELVEQTADRVYGPINGSPTRG